MTKKDRLFVIFLGDFEVLRAIIGSLKLSFWSESVELFDEK